MKLDLHFGGSGGKKETVAVSVRSCKTSRTGLSGEICGDVRSQLFPALLPVRIACLFLLTFSSLSLVIPFRSFSHLQNLYQLVSLALIKLSLPPVIFCIIPHLHSRIDREGIEMSKLLQVLHIFHALRHLTFSTLVHLYFFRYLFYLRCLFYVSCDSCSSSS